MTITAKSSALVLVSDFNLGNLASILARDSSAPSIIPKLAPYGQLMQTILNPDPELWSEDTTGAVIWTSPEAVSGSYKRLCRNTNEGSEGIIGEVDEFCAAIRNLPPHIKYVLVPTWTTAPYEGRLGLLDMDPTRGASLALMRMNLRLAESLSADPRVFVLDASRWTGVYGEKSFSRRLWYMAKTPHSVDLLKLVAQELKSAIRALTGGARKLIIVDLDDTLWGGVVGDIGWDKVRLGGHDPIGEAFKDFQLALKSLASRGILLAVASKNEEKTALEAIRSNREMVLRLEDFAGWRINWEDKAQNIVALAAELNLGLQSVVFIDDNPAERARVRDALTEVFVPDWPINPMDYSATLQGLRCFDHPRITSEDKQRTEMYASERRRMEFKKAFDSADQWLETLNLQVEVEGLNKENLERASQLLNKTNQMNLSTRRLTIAQLWEWSQKPDHALMTFRVCDKFGDYGLVGIASVELDSISREARVVDFVLSCRVMGRKVEETMLHVLTRAAANMGAQVLGARHLPTPKNKPCLDFFERSGFLQAASRGAFSWALDKAYERPKSIGLLLKAPTVLDRSV
jgi:FkbH-like protein